MSSLIDLAVTRGLLSPEQADAARTLSPEQLVERGLIDRRELELLLKLSGTPRLLFDRYEQLEEIGRGGMGVVYKVRDRRLDRIVALKGMPDAFGGDVERFEREARTAARLQHPNIVAVHDFGRRDHEAYLTMDFVDGRSFEAALPSLDRRARIDVVRQIAGALDYAHREGVVHRDVKPENILVDAAGVARLTDFGLGKRLEGDSNLTVSGVVMGTPAYMAPEQAAGRVVGAAADVYSLGGTLYYALGGRRPHEGGDALAVAVSALTEEPPRLRSINANVAADLETICLKAMERDPAARYASAGALGEDLRRFLAGEPILARPPGALRRLRGWTVRHRVAVVGAAVLLVVSALFLGQRWREAARLDAARPHMDAGRKLMRTLDLLRVDPNATPADLDVVLHRAQDEFNAALAAYPEYPEALLELARARRIESDAEALAFCDRAIAASPDFATAYLERALIRLNRYEELRHTSARTLDPTAESEALKAVILADLDAVRRWSEAAEEVVLADGAVKFAEGRFDEAAGDLRRYCEMTRAEPLGWVLLGHALSHIPGREAEALDALSRALVFRPNDVPARLNRGIVFKALGRLDEAIADYDGILARFPRHAEALTNRANAKLAKRDYDGAIADIDLVSVEAAIALNIRAEARRLKGRAAPSDPSTPEVWRLAEADYTRAMELDPIEGDHPQNRGYLRFYLKRYDEAIADMTHAIELMPDQPRLYVERGVIRKAAGDFDGALADYETALERDRTLVEAWWKHALCRVEKGRFADAAADYDEAIKLAPKRRELYLERAQARTQILDERGAVEDWTSALAIEPDDAETLTYRGLCLARAGDVAGGLRDLDRAVELDGDFLAARLNRGLVYESQRRWAEAEIDFTRAIALRPEWGMAY